MAGKAAALFTERVEGVGPSDRGASIRHWQVPRQFSSNADGAHRTTWPFVQHLY